MDNVTSNSDIVRWDNNLVCNKIVSMIDNYIAVNDIKDINKLTQLQFNHLLLYISDNYIKPLKLLYKDNNRYDIDKCDKLLDIYISICYKYNKVITIDGYCSISGISINTYYAWQNGSRQATNDTVELVKKLNKYNELSLSNKLLSKDINPVGVIAILNHTHNWQQQETIKQRQAESLPLDKIGDMIGIDMTDLSDNNK